MRTLLIPAITKFLGGLRFRNLFLVTAALFVINVFVPDVIPFADEILLGLATLVLARWKDENPPGQDRRRSSEGTTSGQAPSPRDVIDLPRDQVKREG